MRGRRHESQSTPDCAPSGAHVAPKHPVTPTATAQHAADEAARAAHAALVSGATIAQAQEVYGATYAAALNG